MKLNRGFLSTDTVRMLELCLVLVCGVLLGFGAVEAPVVRVLEDQGSRLTIEVVVPEYTVAPLDIDGQACVRITLPGQVTFLERGMPELPTMARNIIIPDDGRMAYRVLETEYETQPSLPIVPSKGNLYRNTNPDDVPYVFDAVYGQDVWWPAQVVEVSEPFIMRDYRGMTLRFNPFQYNGMRGELRVVKRLVVEVYEVGKGGANVHPGRGALAREFVDIYDGLFLNFGPARYDSISERAGRMVVITADAYLNNLDSFKEWKRKKGIATKVVNISTIGNNQTSIKNFIQSEYDAGGLVWVLLVGDGNEVVPALGTSGAASGAAADPVYAYTAGGDYYPDLIVSRFSSRGGNAVMIDKQASRAIGYEMGNIEYVSWYHDGLGVASDQTGGTGYADSTRANWLRDSLLEFTYTAVNKSYDSWGTRAMIKGFIEAGTSTINYIGHGGVYGWGNGGGFSVSDIDNLNNPWMLPFVISVACDVGSFNGNDCYCEASVAAGTVEQPDGFLVHWGSSIGQSWVPPCVGQEGAVNLLTHSKKNTFGGMCFNGACYMIENYGGAAAGVEMAQTWHIFGDGSVQVRTDAPQAMIVSHAQSIAVGDTLFSISVENVSDALVGLYVDTLLVGHGYTDSTGDVVIRLEEALNEPGTMHITVTAFNKVSYIDSIPIIVQAVEENAQYTEPGLTRMTALYPNPFSSTAAIEYTVASEHSEATPSITIFDACGRQIKTFSRLSAKAHNRVLWDATNDAGQSIPSGVYFVHFAIAVHGTTEYRQIDTIVLSR